MDAVKYMFLVLLCFQCGVSYRIYILPEPGAFCLGVFSGDDCITWSEYSARPKFVDHSTTLIFTPGSYSLRSRSTFSVANIKSFTMTGDGATLQFQISLSNIGYVHLHGLTFNSPSISVRYVDLFALENCTLSRPPGSSSTGLRLYGSNLKKIDYSTFERVSIADSQSRTALSVRGCIFMNISHGSCIVGDSITVHSSRFVNNYAGGNIFNGVVNGRRSVMVVDCLFDRSTGGGAVYNSDGDVTIINSTFISNEVSYESGNYRHNVYHSSYRGGYAIRGRRNINIRNCTFRFYLGHTTISMSYSNYYRYNTRYRLYITNSNFSHSNQTVDADGAVDVIISNCSLYNITYHGHGGAIYSSKSVTIMDCAFDKVKTVDGNGGAIYSSKNVTIINSTISNGGSQFGSGGAVYGRENVTIINSTIINSTATSGNGGAVYSGNNAKVVNVIIKDSMVIGGVGGAIYSVNDVTAVNSTIQECSALTGKGGAVYFAANRQSTSNFKPNIVFSNCTFKHNSATSGGVLYTYGYYNHHVEFTDCLFESNEATVGGGVAFLRNTTLITVNSNFKNNTAAGDGGVLDLSFASVSVERCTFTGNEAGDNGGVFYGRDYSVNFTIERTDFDHNSARDGGVFYVHRGNSNIKIVDRSTFIENTASNQSGVMDIRGVTLTMDMDTVIANNTAGSSGDVISACVSQITTYGLEARPDPVYPLYCSIYDEENSTNPTSPSSGTDSSTTQITPITEQLTTASQPIDKTSTITRNKPETESFVTKVESATTTHDAGISTTQEMKPSIATTAQQSSSFMATSGDVGEVTTSSPSSTTLQLTTKDSPPLHHSLTTSPTLKARTDDTPSHINSMTDDAKNVVTGVQSTTRASVSPTTGSDARQDNGDSVTLNDSKTSMATESHHKTEAKPTDHPADIMDLTGGPNDNNNITHSEDADSSTASLLTSSSTELTSTSDSRYVKKTDSSATTSLLMSVSGEVQANEEDKYGVWSRSQQSLLQVAIISLAILCAICFIVCAIMIVLFFIACQKRNAPPQGYYKKVPLTEDVKLSETKELGKE